MLAVVVLSVVRYWLSVIHMKQRLFSGIQPSGNLHIGNYLGAIRQWILLQDEYEAFFSVVDLHAITVPQDPAELRQKTLEIVKIYLAAGIDPSKATLFVQSQVAEHTELMWILNTITKNGDLTKMTQFKSKSGFQIGFDDFEEQLKNLSNPGMLRDSFAQAEIQGSESLDVNSFQRGLSTLAESLLRDFSEIKLRFNSVGVGLFDYPVLMAADILLYDTAVVPVGEDQVQHVELTRTLARRFNDRFPGRAGGETFTVPEPRVMKEGARIMGLDDPTKKMSKSAASIYNYIALQDDPELARKKIMKAVTDSGSEIAYQDSKPALKNLINIYSLLGDESPESIVARYAGKGYVDFKRDLADVVAVFLTEFQAKLAAISDDEALRVLHEGAERARAVASAKMKDVREKVGFLS
jgi:tryptophanyl-tRNA synthetase